jgi:hypothetical protein
MRAYVARAAIGAHSIHLYTFPSTLLVRELSFGWLSVVSSLELMTIHVITALL